MKTICMVNEKGGVGKSTLCLHLSGAFAALGQRVLLIDADPQGSLSKGFWGPQKIEELELCHTVAALFDESLYASDVRPLFQPTLFERIMFVPANDHLKRFNHPVPEETGMRQYMLREFVDRLEGFDLVLIDCPPNLYTCSWNAMVASDYVVIPVPPEDFGTQGLRPVHRAINQVRTLNPSLRRLGHLIARRDQRLVMHRNYEQRLRKTYQQLVLNTVIPELTAYKTAITARRPVEINDPKSAAAECMRCLAAEILERMSVRESKPEAA